MSGRWHWSRRLQGKRLLIFDFDGTIADSSPLHAAAFADVLRPLGIRVDYPSIAGLKSADAMRQCLVSHGVVLDEGRIANMVAEKQGIVRKLIAAGLQPLPGVDDFLRWSRSRYRLGMYTSGSRETVTIALRALGYEGFFDPLICAEDVDRAKPDPEGFLLALQLAGIAPSDAMVFEDSVAGVLAAGAARMECWNVAEHPLGQVGSYPEAGA